MSPHRLIAFIALASLGCNLISRELATPSPSAPDPSATALPASATPAPEFSPTPPPTTTPILTTVNSLPDPAGFRWLPISDGFTEPLDLQGTGDGRLFVVEQRGVILTIQDGAVLPEPFLDIRDRVNDSSLEQGLLGLTFHPQFLGNGFFYVNYTRAGGDTIIARFTASPEQTSASSVEPGTVHPGSELVLLEIDQPFPNHNGGGMAFGPDGYLYIATGDGGLANDPFGNGQRLDTLLGKLLRIDVDSGEPYAIPPDNPFSSGAASPEIWIYGLRNPWRFSFDSMTGDLYIGDVGQNRWEEIDFLSAGSPGGANFGWNHREGRHAFGSQITEGLIDPVAEYANTGGTCAVTGGVVVRDPALPEWYGVYLFGDYCSGEVWGLVRDQAGHWQVAVLFNTGLFISSFGTGADGSVYLVDHGGTIYRLVRSG